jgi:hypothetical protein
MLIKGRNDMNSDGKNGKNDLSNQGSSVAIADEQQWSVPGVRIGRSQQLTTPAPRNRLIDAANPDIFLPPPTDTGSMPTFKYPFSVSISAFTRADGRARLPSASCPSRKILQA